MIKQLYAAKNKKVELRLSKKEADLLHKEVESFFSTPKMKFVTYKAEYCRKNGLSYFLPNLQIVVKRKYETKSTKRGSQQLC